MVRIVKKITREEYERVKFIYNLYRCEIISEKESEEIIDYFAKQEREKQKNLKKNK